MEIGLFEIFQMISYVNLFLSALIVCFMLLAFGFWQIMLLWIELKAMKQSTHQVTYINPLSKADPNADFENLTDKLKEKLQAEFNPDLVPEE